MKALQKNLTLVLFFVIFVLSGLFRLTNLDLIEFKADEAINLFLASRPLFGHPFVPGGTASSLGILNPPLFTYILFPFTLFSLEPPVITFFIALINSLSIGFLFLIIKRYYKIATAIITTVLMAFSPWSIIFSRKIWTQDLLVPFMAIFIYSIHELILNKKDKFLLPLISSSLFLIQLHQSSIFFIGAAFVFLIFKRIKINYKYALFGFVIGFIPLIPYILYELNNGCPDCQTLLSTNSLMAGKYSFQTFLRPLQIISQGGFYQLLGDDMLTFSNNFPIVYKLRYIFYFEYLLLPLGIILFIKEHTKMRFLAYAATLLPFIYYVLGIEPFIHYFIIITPLLFLFLANAITYLIDSKNLFLKFGTLFYLVSLILASLSFNIAFYSLLSKQKALKGDYGVTYAVIDQWTKKDLVAFSTKKDYQEIVLFDRIPFEFTFGYMPVAKMIYSDISKTNLSNLEKKLKEKPLDPRVKHEIFAFYTQKPTTRETLNILWQKKLIIPEYESIYRIIRNHYLSGHSKKETISSFYNIIVDYPQHWSSQEDQNQLFIKGDGLIMEIKYLNEKISDKPTRRIECITEDQKWCGVTYESMHIGYNTYFIRYYNSKNSYKLRTKRVQEIKSIMEDIVSSIRTTELIKF